MGARAATIGIRSSTRILLRVTRATFYVVYAVCLVTCGLRMSMRLALAVLLVALAAAPVAAQQARPSQQAKPSQQAPANPPNQSGQPAQSAQPSQFNQLPASGKPSQAEEVLRQRILLREKFNKGWDVQNEDPRAKKARCKSEARKKFTAIHPLKRRKFQKECMAQAGR
jgi:hypothetical protein